MSWNIQAILSTCMEGLSAAGCSIHCSRSCPARLTPMYETLWSVRDRALPELNKLAVLDYTCVSVLS